MVRKNRKCNFQHYFKYVVAVSFIVFGQRSIWRKPPPCLKYMKFYLGFLAPIANRTRMLRHMLGQLKVIFAPRTANIGPNYNLLFNGGS